MAIPVDVLRYQQLLFNVNAPGITLSGSASGSGAVQLPPNGSIVRIVSEGPNVSFYAFGPDATVLATLPVAGMGTPTCLAVLSGEDVTFQRDPTIHKFVSVICRASGTSVASVYCGEGA